MREIIGCEVRPQYAVWPYGSTYPRNTNSGLIIDLISNRSHAKARTRVPPVARRWSRRHPRRPEVASHRGGAAPHTL